MNKKRILTSYEKLKPELLSKIKEIYPDGFEHYVFKVKQSINTFFYAFLLDMQDTTYLVRVNEGWLGVPPESGDDLSALYYDNEEIDDEPSNEIDE